MDKLLAVGGMLGIFITIMVFISAILWFLIPFFVWAIASRLHKANQTLTGILSTNKEQTASLEVLANQVRIQQQYMMQQQHYMTQQQQPNPEPKEPVGQGDEILTCPDCNQPSQKSKFVPLASGDELNWILCPSCGSEVILEEPKKLAIG